MMNSRSLFCLVMGFWTVGLLMTGCNLQGAASTTASGSLLIPASSVFANFLTFVEVQKQGVGGVEGINGIWSVATSRDGRHVYAAGYRSDAVAVFTRDSTTGKLHFVETRKSGIDHVEGLRGVVSVVVSPDGKFVYTGAYWDEAVVVFSRDPMTGKLSSVEIQKNEVGGVDGLNGIRSLAISPDGKHVYVTTYRDRAVVVFSRDETTGKLLFVQLVKKGIEGVDGLDGAASAVVSQDGMHLYATGSIESAVAVFNRDRATGKLALVEAQRNGVAGVEGLGGANSVTISADGKHVYVAGFSDSAVAAFGRDEMTGKLTFLETQKDGVGGVDGLDGTSSIVTSPDGKKVYVGGYLDNAVVVFDRDSGTGKLAFREVHREGVNGVKGLTGVRSVVASPDGRHVYAAGNADKALAVFSTSVP